MTGVHHGVHRGAAGVACAVVVLTVVIGSLGPGVGSHGGLPSSGARSVRAPLDVAPAHPAIRSSGVARGSGSVRTKNLGPSSSITAVTGVGYPTGVAYDGQNGNLYVAADEGTEVMVWNATTFRYIQAITIPGAVQGPFSVPLAYDPANGRLYVAVSGGGGQNPGTNVTVINGTTDQVETSLNVGPDPTAIVADPSNGQVYVSTGGTNSGADWWGNLTVINGSTDRIAGYVPVPASSPCKGLTSLAYDPSNGYVYAMGLGELCWVDPASNSWAGNLSLYPTGGAGQVGTLAFDPADGDLYAAAESIWVPNGTQQPSELYVVNASTDRIVEQVRLPFSSPGPRVESNMNLPGVGYDGRTGEVLVAGANYGGEETQQPQFSSIVWVFNGSSQVGTFYTGQDSNVIAPGIAYDPQSGDAFVSNAGDSSVSIVPPQMPLAPTVSPAVAQVVTQGTQIFTAASSTCLDGSCSSPLRLTWALNDSVGTLNATTGVSVGFTAGTVPGEGTLNVSVTSEGYTEVTPVPIRTHAPFQANLTASVFRTDVNASLTLTTLVSGGTGGPYGFRYAESSPIGGCRWKNASQVTCTPTTVGSFSVSVNVTDSTGESSIADSPTIVVGPQLFARLSVSNSTPLLGQTVAFVANATGGVAPYNYTYTGLPPGCVSEDAPAVGCLPTQSEYYNITVHVRDQDNVTVNATVTMHVIFDFNVVVPATGSVGNPFTISVNTNETFSAAGPASGGTDGFSLFTYHYAGLPPGCSSQDVPQLVCTPSQNGTYPITVTVYDDVGDHNSHTVVVTILSRSASPGGGAAGGLPIPLDLLVTGGLAGLVAAAVVTALVIRRTKRQKSI